MFSCLKIVDLQFISFIRNENSKKLQDTVDSNN